MKDEIKPRYEALSGAWQEAEAKLLALDYPLEVEVRQYEEDGTSLLGLVRYKGKRCICHGTLWTENGETYPVWKPIRDCPTDLRVAMVKVYPRLYAATVEALKNFIPVLDDAIATLQGYIDEVKPKKP